MSAEVPLYCDRPECPRSPFWDIQDLAAHFQRRHDLAPDKAVERAHALVPADPSIWSCPLCQRPRRDRRELIAHLRGFHDLNADEAERHALAVAGTLAPFVGAAIPSRSPAPAPRASSQAPPSPTRPPKEAPMPIIRKCSHCRETGHRIESCPNKDKPAPLHGAACSDCKRTDGTHAPKCRWSPRRHVPRQVVTAQKKKKKKKKNRPVARKKRAAAPRPIYSTTVVTTTFPKARLTPSATPPAGGLSAARQAVVAEIERLRTELGAAEGALRLLDRLGTPA